MKINVPFIRILQKALRPEVRHLGGEPEEENTRTKFETGYVFKK
jgi:hypothetical protein